MLKAFWQGLSRTARAGFVAGVLLIAGITLALAWWTLRTDYQVLFANLSLQDAGAMTAELERMKVPYKLDENGTTILVDRGLVHKTRLKLMGKDLPLHGAVGFELFNNADFGMTEFAQKVNYQRALQGELTRTILSLDEIESARVHLVLPEEGLFKRGNSKAKASITVALKQGQSLRPEQVTGIQRLVAAAVARIAPQDVTIVNRQGVALTRAAPGEGAIEGGTRLDLKRDTEQHLARKAAQVLEHAFGPGQALASVDVTLDMDQVRITTEDVIPVPGKPNQVPTGVMVRERETLRDGAAPLAREGSGGSSQRETEYQAGRRVEQIISQPGSIKRLQVVAVVGQSLDATRIEEIKTLVGAAVGAVRERGDTVVVQTLAGVAGAPGHGVDSAAAESVSAARSHAHEPASATSAQVLGGSMIGGLVVLLVALTAAGIGWKRYRRSTVQSSTTTPLSAEQREAMLMQIRHWTEEAGIKGEGV